MVDQLALEDVALLCLEEPLAVGVAVNRHLADLVEPLPADSRLQVHAASLEPRLASLDCWRQRLSDLRALHQETSSQVAFELWLEQRLGGVDVPWMARIAVRETTGPVPLEWWRSAAEEALAQLGSETPASEFPNPLYQVPLDPAGPGGELLIYLAEPGPVDLDNLRRSIRANNLECRFLTVDPGFRGYRNGQVALALHYREGVVRKNRGSLLLGESTPGRAELFAGSLAQYQEKNKAHWPAGLRAAEVRSRLATYTAKHEILIHHTGYFLKRGHRRDYRGLIRTDSYALDGYLESNHPADLLGNRPTLVSPRHPLRLVNQ